MITRSIGRLPGAGAPRYLPGLFVGLLLTLICIDEVQGETIRRRYDFEYDRRTRRASSMMAEAKARKQILRDFLAEKFSPEITLRYPEDIDIALDPPDQYITGFNVISERLNADETRVTLTVEADVDFTSMITSLVQNKVLSFGKEPPKVMVLPSSRFEDPKSAKTIRALIFDHVRQSGLRPVAFEGIAQSVTFRVRQKVEAGEAERRSLIRQAVEYGADYLIYIDTEIDAKPFSQGGYICDANFIYTILRPNGSLMLGESIVSERGSGSSRMLAFDRALDSVAPVIAKGATGDLFRAIYSDSDVIYGTPRIRGEKTIVVHWAPAQLVQAVAEQLQHTGARATLGTGMSEVASRLRVETEMDDFELYQWFNGQVFSVGGRVYKTPVVAYSENVVEVEAVAERAQPRRNPIATAPPRPQQPRAPRPRQEPSISGEPIAKVTLKLRPAQFNR